MRPAEKTASAVEVILGALEEEHVDYIFGVPGGALTPLHEALEDRGTIRHVLAKHEEGAAFMANGYARVRRGLGVCAATTGPGGTNALTGIAASYMDSVPTLLLTGQVSTRAVGRGALQDSSVFGVPLTDIFRHVTKLSAELSHPDRTSQLVHRAIRTALGGRPGPVHLSLPVDMLKQRVSYFELPSERYRSASAPVDREGVARLAQLFVEAERPCILAGHGTNVSGAEAALRELAELLRVPVATTPMAKGCFPEDHDLSLGVFGFAGHPLADRYLLSSEVDLLVVLGSSLGELVTHTWDRRLLNPASFVQVDIDPTAIGNNYPVELGIVGDIRATLVELLEACRGLLGDRRRSVPSSLLEARAVTLPIQPIASPVSSPSRMVRPSEAVPVLQEELPEDTLVFIDSGNCVSWMGRHFRARRPRSYFLNMGLSSMGHAVAAAIGGKLAAPDKPVVAIVGDAAFAMNGMEVHTAVEENVPVVWIVLNNGGHGMVYQGEKLLLGRHLGACQFRVPLDPAALARAVGATGYRSDTIPSFREHLRAALESRVPTVIDLHIDPEEIPPSLMLRARTVGASLDQIALSIRPP